MQRGMTDLKLTEDVSMRVLTLSANAASESRAGEPDELC